MGGGSGGRKLGTTRMMRHTVAKVHASILRVTGLIAVCVAIAGCSLVAFVPEHQETPPPPVSVVVEITGSPGVTFEGSLGTAGATRTISGQVPATYTVNDAVALAVSVTNKDADGDLTVRVLRSGAPVAQRTTHAPYGTVLLVYKPCRRARWAASCTGADRPFRRPCPTPPPAMILTSFWPCTGRCRGVPGAGRPWESLTSPSGPC
jgi:hypothetical protein